MHTNISPNKQRRQRRTETPPFRRVSHTLPLGQTPAVRQLLEVEGLWTLNTPELREVYYSYTDQHNRRREFCAIGWRNENGGYEVRGPKFNGYIGRKGMTFIPGSNFQLLIFPDMTGYLCWRHSHPHENPGILVLNHAEFANAAARRALHYPSVIVYQDQDPIHLTKHAAAA